MIFAYITLVLAACCSFFSVIEKRKKKNTKMPMADVTIPLVGGFCFGVIYNLLAFNNHLFDPYSIPIAGSLVALGATRGKGIGKLMGVILYTVSLILGVLLLRFL